MGFRASLLCLGGVLLSASLLPAQIRHPRHSRYPDSPSNDPQLQIPTDQAQSCFVPDGPRSADEQFQQFDSFQQPASKGYLCISVPAAGIFVVDQLFAEADYDSATPAPPEWYLDTVIGGDEAMTGFAAERVGASTRNPHYVVSQPVHLAITGGTRVTLIMHNYFVSGSNSIGETPGTASFLLVGHWEQ